MARSSEEPKSYYWVHKDRTYGDVILNEENSCRSYWLSRKFGYFNMEDDMKMNMFYVSKNAEYGLVTGQFDFCKELSNILSNITY